MGGPASAGGNREEPTVAVVRSETETGVSLNRGHIEEEKEIPVVGHTGVELDYCKRLR